MRILNPGRLARLGGLFGLLLVGCGPDFDPPSELHSLRVLGVQKDVPYAQPGDQVNLQILWQDASPLAPRAVSIAWSGPCVNPAGDLYYGCFDPAQKAFADISFGSETTSFKVPTDIISARNPNAPPSNNAPYGLSYVFFAVCAGTFTTVPQTSETAFPLGCQGPDGTLLGSDDFVAGYTSVYSFAQFSNHNPVVTGFQFNGVEYPATDEAGGASACVDAACRARAGSRKPVDFDCSDPAFAARCIPTCAKDGDASCPAYALRPSVDRTDPRNTDLDDVSAALLGRTVGEQMWINYYTDAGGFKSPVRLLSDATTGWNDDFGTAFYAPKTPGPFRVWAVVHDNRGGAAWSGLTLKAQ